MHKPVKTYWRDGRDGPPPMDMELLIVGAWLLLSCLMWWGGYHLIAWVWGLAWG